MKSGNFAVGNRTGRVHNGSENDEIMNIVRAYKHHTFVHQPTRSCPFRPFIQCAVAFNTHKIHMQAHYYNNGICMGSVQRKLLSALAI